VTREEAEREVRKTLCDVDCTPDDSCKTRAGQCGQFKDAVDDLLKGNDAHD
jgi:hypothetical protein